MKMMLALTHAISIPELYDEIARQAISSGRIEAGDYRYDCTKISVSEQITYWVEEFYKANYSDWKMVFGMHWCCFGPKTDTNLTGHNIEIEDGFFMREEVA